MTLVRLLRVAGVLMVGIASANFPAARMFRHRDSRRGVPAHVAEVFWVQNVFIVLIVLGMAGPCLALPADPAGGGRLGRATSGMLAVF